KVKGLIEDLNLNTVCTGANCPNRMECFNRGTATFMVLGNYCTRNCKFCDVVTARPEAVDKQEPTNIAQAVNKLDLKHAVITSVTRDDLPDQGANHFKEIVYSIKEINPNTTVELLIPDMQGQTDLIDIIINADPDVLNHNIETVPRLYDRVRPQAIFQRSLDLLKYEKKKKPDMITKSGIMVGLGESKDEVIETMKALRNVDCNMLTIGQYLQPSKNHLPVEEYITPDQFKEYETIGLDLGFKHVASGPLVRSSYHADKFM